MQHPGGTCVALPNVDACPQLSCAALTFMYLQQVSLCDFFVHVFPSCIQYVLLLLVDIERRVEQNNCARVYSAKEECVDM